MQSHSAFKLNVTPEKYYKPLNTYQQEKWDKDTLKLYLFYKEIEDECEQEIWLKEIRCFIAQCFQKGRYLTESLSLGDMEWFSMDDPLPDTSLQVLYRKQMEEKDEEQDLFQKTFESPLDKITKGEICRYCGAHSVRMIPRQTRSSDEPTNFYFQCLNCQKNWKL
jgi:hypothetical protein